jgi:hypothetical protein
MSSLGRAQTFRDLDVSDVDAVVARLTDDCLYHEDPHWLDGRTFEGREGIAAILNEYVGVWGATSQTVEWAESSGNGVLAGIRQRGETPQGQVPIDQIWTYAFKFRGDFIAEIWAFADENEGRGKMSEVSVQQ